MRGHSKRESIAKKGWTHGMARFARVRVTKGSANGYMTFEQLLRLQAAVGLAVHRLQELDHGTADGRRRGIRLVIKEKDKQIQLGDAAMRRA